MKKQKSNLDEMQEQKLLQIEHNMAWLAWGGLLAAILVQLLVFGPQGIQYIWGEWLLFMVLCVYMVAACIRNGVFDRYIKPEDKKSQFLLSLGFSVVAALVVATVIYRRCGSLATAAIFFAGMLVVMLLCCMAALHIAVKVFRRRVEKLEASDGEES